MARRKQEKRHSGIGSLVQRRGRWYIVGCETVTGLDGKTKKKRPHKALPKDIVTRADATREFNRMAQEARAGKGHHKPSTKTVKALCEAWEAAQDAAHPLTLSTARQWANVHGDKQLDGYGTADLLAFRRVIEESAIATRGVINAKMGRVRQIVKWGTATGHAPDGLLSRLQALAPLMAGRTQAAEGKGRTPASVDAFKAVLPHLPEPFRAITIILRWTAARPSEILGLVPAEVNTTDFPWIISKVDHKTAGKGKHRAFALPDPAEAALTPYLDRSPCFAVSTDTNPTRPLAMAIESACKAAGVEVFTPYQLRHLRLTEIAQQCGPEMAQAAAGHSSASMTLNYTKQAAEERALALAKAAALVGVD